MVRRTLQPSPWNIVSMGARPVLIADCLNFGNPERPDSYLQFVEAVRGLGQFSHDLAIPIVGGNVSLYNEAEVEGITRRINPTPQIMIAGLFDQDITPIRRNLTKSGSRIFLVGETTSELNGSALQHHQLGRVEGMPPVYRSEAELQGQDAILKAHKKHLILSCNNVGRGGLAIALMKMVMRSELGFRVSLENHIGGANTLGEKLFSESSARYVVEVADADRSGFEQLMHGHKVPFYDIGKTVSDHIADFGAFAIPVRNAMDAFYGVLDRYMEQ
jgi:phosphoribosylformylglycinamidine (FGAM) synthase-like enzyme